MFDMYHLAELLYNLDEYEHLREVLFTLQIERGNSWDQTNVVQT